MITTSFKQWNSLAIALLVLAQSVTPVAAEEYNPFRLPKSEFVREIKTIALWPVLVPSGLKDAASVRTELEPMITKALEEAGYSVIASNEFEERWQVLSEHLGGLFDPVTGESDDAEIDLVRQLVSQDLAMTLKADALLVPRVSHGEVRVWAQTVGSEESESGRSYVAWMAGDEPAKWRGKGIQAYYRDMPERVTGPRLGIRIFDPVDTSLYDVMIPIHWTRVYLAGSYEDRPEVSLLDDRERVEEVIAGLVDPLKPDSGEAGETDEPSTK